MASDFEYNELSPGTCLPGCLVAAVIIGCVDPDGEQTTGARRMNPDMGVEQAGNTWDPLLGECGK